ncbi:hypothetical protein [Bradyrhizobium sp. Leo170]|uniref:tyrosine-type recombinase/integrase n=1 Tax=Bradyrhizobium sp. Leo170 TaxID=1571199 RepID=UPI00102E2262|nr:hypothetical protein [Bradyrhizobium sp. Leo170]TAI60401.1 hypothetical protein CWO89_40860 [Bradyrhizobium sp. Leo170]
MLTADNALRLPDGGPDGRGGRKQKCYTERNGMQLLVCGDSRLYYSPWEVPPHLLKPGAKRAIKREPLGSAQDVSFATALTQHLKIRDDITRGVYPKPGSTKGAGRRKSGPTFQTYATPRVAGWAAKRKNKKDAAGMINILPRHCAAINELPIETIGTPQVLKALEPIWETKPAMAEEVRALIARVLKAAAREELRPNSDVASAEAIIAVLGKPKKKRGKIRGPMKSVDYEDMPQFMTELRAIKSQTSRALEALILSNLRTNPVRFLHIDHLDFDGTKKDAKRPGPKWTVPGGPDGLMKVDDDDNDFVLPMVPRLVAVLQEQIAYLRETFPGVPVGLLFPGDPNQVDDPFSQPISENTMRDLVVGPILNRKATPHGFRASFKTWASNQVQDDGETKKFDRDAVEYCMAHNPGDEEERVYRRDTLWRPRVGIMTAWARHLAAKASLKMAA